MDEWEVSLILEKWLRSIHIFLFSCRFWQEVISIALANQQKSSQVQFMYILETLCVTGNFILN